MTAVKGIVKNGQIVVGEPLDWPDGTEVIVRQVAEEETFGVPEEDRQDTPEAIAAWIQWFDSIEPLQMTPEEEAEWQAARQAQKEFEKARFMEHADKLRRMWE